VVEFRLGRKAGTPVQVREACPIGFYICPLGRESSAGARVWNFKAFSFVRVPNGYFKEAQMVDKDRIKGSAEQAKGKVKEWAGKATGDKKTQAKGKADQVKGKVRNAVGGLKDAVRGK
jgi:uncharacterized protein YjbJ (UPF0337 family)